MQFQGPIRAMAIADAKGRGFLFEMMNENEEDVDLRLITLSSNNYCIGTRPKNSSGAGVNAINSKMDLAFAASDPLSELVWSPHNGVSLKCANSSSAADKRPFLVWNVGPTTSIRSNGDEDDICCHKATLVRPSSRSCPTAEIGGASCGDRDDGQSNIVIEGRDETRAAIQREENCPVNEEKDLCRPENNVQVADIAVISQKSAGLNTLEDVVSDRKAGMAMNLEVGTEEMNKNETEMPYSIPFPVERSPTNSRICLHKNKGKQKVLLSDVRSSNDEEGESDESIESSNSAGLFSKGLKRHGCDEGQITLGSKRMKKQTDHGDQTSIMKPDSSFMNWISNMVKCLSDSNKEGSSSSLALTLTCSNNKLHDSSSVSMGFQTIFQSLLCRNANISVRKEKDSMHEEYAEFAAANKSSVDEDLPESCEEKNDDSHRQIFISNKEVKQTAEIPSVDSDVSKQGLNNPLNTSMWITRFSMRAPTLGKQDVIAQEMNCTKEVCQVNDVSPIDHESPEHSSKLIFPIMPSRKFENSEAMASVFARRLDALKHITPPEMRNCTTCFFCGSGHDLRECPDITETELEGLVLKLSCFDGVKESSSLCLRCFQLDHWAISCPMEEPLERGFLWNVMKSSSKRVCRSNEFGESSLAKKDAKGKKKSPLFNIVATPSRVSPLEIVQAVRSLRLSRGDILRWMNSDIPLSRLNGFFLRLRLGKSEAVFEGRTGYYVACITGEAGKNDGWSKKSILVDVGGIKSAVGSQYVSNQDFLEDEVKAWWCRILDSGCRIPSLDEMNSKFNDRKNLGF